MLKCKIFEQDKTVQDKIWNVSDASWKKYYKSQMTDRNIKWNVYYFYEMKILIKMLKCCII